MSAFGFEISKNKKIKNLHMTFTFSRGNPMLTIKISLALSLKNYFLYKTKKCYA